MCNCNKNKGTGSTTSRVTVQTPNGLRITKANKAAAEAYVSGHPGAKIV